MEATELSLSANVELVSEQLRQEIQSLKEQEEEYRTAITELTTRRQKLGRRIDSFNTLLSTLTNTAKLLEKE